MKRNSILLSISMVLMFFAMTIMSCATSVAVQITKPAEINMSAYKKVVVFEFSYPERYWWSETDRIVSYASSAFIQGLTNTQYFQVINAKDITNWRGMSNIEIGQKTGAQAIIVPEILSFFRDSQYRMVQEETKDPKTGLKSIVNVQYVKIVDDIDVSFRVVDATTGSVIATKEFRESKTQDGKNGSSFVSQLDTGKAMIDKIIPYIVNMLAPHTVTEYRSLMSDKTNDPAMKTADKLVQNKEYDKALAMYLEIYAKTKNVAAGVNAAILYEILGQIDEAIALIDKVVAETGNADAKNEAKRLRAVKAEQDKLAEQK